jgi:hypothetical protein
MFLSSKGNAYLDLNIYVRKYLVYLILISLIGTKPKASLDIKVIEVIF